MRPWLLVLSILLLGGCGSGTRPDMKLLDETLDQYASVIRWESAEQALAFIDPEYRKAHPIRPFDLERFQQIQITDYRAQAFLPQDETTIKQIVQIDLVNRHTQIVRTLVDAQIWRYDPIAKRWWLTTGLPNITAAH